MGKVNVAVNYQRYAKVRTFSLCSQYDRYPIGWNGWVTERILTNLKHQGPNLKACQGASICRCGCFHVLLVGLFFVHAHTFRCSRLCAQAGIKECPFVGGLQFGIRWFALFTRRLAGMRVWNSYTYTSVSKAINLWQLKIPLASLF